MDDFLEIWYLSIFRKCIEKSQVLWKSDNNEDQNTLLIISRSILLTMRNVSDKRCTENQNTFYIQESFFLESRAVYEIMWKNIVQPDTPRMKIRRMHITCWMLKATDTHSEYIIRIAFPLQKRLHERPSILRYTYIACLVILYFHPCIIFQVLYSIS